MLEELTRGNEEVDSPVAHEASLDELPAEEGAILDQLAQEGALDGFDCRWRAAFSGCSRIGMHASRRRFYRVGVAASQAHLPQAHPPQAHLPQAHLRQAAGGAGSAVLVVYPDDASRVPGARAAASRAHQEVDVEVARYARTRSWFASAGVSVPKLLANGRRALLVEDCGDVLLDSVASAAGSDPTATELGRLYRQAVDAIVRLQHGETRTLPNPEWALDAARLRAELELTETHAFANWLGVADGAARRREHFDVLAAMVGRMSMVPCHRDYHARNLLIRRDRVIVIDFQDVMAGPLFYDLASLLRDNYCDVSSSLEAELAARFWAAARGGRSAAAITHTDDFSIPDRPRGMPAAARQAFALVELQRGLKALGTFGNQIAEAGNPAYELYVPRTWSHVVAAARGLQWESLLSALEPVGAALEARLRSSWAPG